ncbi:unnamed protein product, partial [Hymenolepis diminuta]
AITVSIEAKHSNLKIARFVKVVRSFVCKVRKDLLNDRKGDELVVTRKRREHCQLSAYSFTTSEFLRRMHGMA